MACNKCNCETLPCGCEKGLTTPPPCSVNTVYCPTPNPCAEEFSSDCIVYTGPELLCINNRSLPPILDSIIPTGVSVSEAIQMLVNYVCSGDSQQGLVNLRVNGTVTSTTIPLIWNPITGNTSYTINMKLSSDPISSFAVVATISNTYATVTGLLPNTSYDFYIAGVSSGQSMYVRITTLA